MEFVSNLGSMRMIRGEQLEIDNPSSLELEWIFSQLSRPKTYIPLSLAQAPTREDFFRELLYPVEKGGRQAESVKYHILRRRCTGDLWGFFVEYGWEGAFDTIREFDLSVKNTGQSSLSQLVDAHIIGAQYIFLHRFAQRLRWCVKARAKAPPRWYARLGARHIASVSEPHPVTRHPTPKYVFEITFSEFCELFRKHGLNPEAEYGLSGMSGRDLMREVKPR